LEKLRELCMKVDDRLRHRVKSAKDWLKEVRKAPVPSPVDGTRLDQAIKQLEGCDVNGTSNALVRLREAADSVCNALKKAFSGDGEELRRLRMEKSDLDGQIAQLRAGLPPIPQPLLNALRSQLLHMGGELPARALREICEVSDENWREAVEVAFTEKFAI